MCNGRYYGGGSMPVPEARMDDGVLETILVKTSAEAQLRPVRPAYPPASTEISPQSPEW